MNYVLRHNKFCEFPVYYAVVAELGGRATLASHWRLPGVLRFMTEAEAQQYRIDRINFNRGRLGADDGPDNLEIVRWQDLEAEEWREASYTKKVYLFFARLARGMLSKSWSTSSR